jgi:hypothetical protein
MVNRCASHSAKHRVCRSGGAVNVKSHPDEAIYHILNLVFRRPFLHYNNHILP